MSRRQDHEDTQPKRIADRLPELGDLLISDVSLLERVKGLGDGFEEFVTLEGRVALARGMDEFETRTRVRKLAGMAIAYLTEQSRFVLILRLRDLTQEKPLAPTQPNQGANMGLAVASLVEIQGQLLNGEDRLVELWTSYHSQRQAVARELGLMPVGDWPAFYEQVLGAKGRPGRVNPAPQTTPVITPPR